jgi:uncharacterized YigZ family protein
MSEEITKYKTIASATTGDFRDRGSKFLAYAYPVVSASAVKEKIQALKKEHPKAVHYCYAYRIGTNGTQFRAVDDGEPSGSAGKPILGQIDSMGLTNVMVAVVRYFGGTLLGVPGLINAYKTATNLALENAPAAEKWIEKLTEINFDYPAMGEVLYMLKQAEAIIYKQDLQLFCAVTAGIPKVNYDGIVKKLSEIRGVSLRIAEHEL